LAPEFGVAVEEHTTPTVAVTVTETVEVLPGWNIVITVAPAAAVIIELNVVVAVEREAVVCI